jgi:hypothetical protein
MARVVRDFPRCGRDHDITAGQCAQPVYDDMCTDLGAANVDPRIDTLGVNGNRDAQRLDRACHLLHE